MAFSGGNISYQDILSAVRDMASAAGSVSTTPTTGGTLTIDGVSLGNYDYLVKNGDQTISSFLNSDWFTTTSDTASMFVVVAGALTLNAGQVFKPTNRKLFVVVYATNGIVANGQFSVDGRGANHSGTGNSGGATTKGNILIMSGTASSVVNPKVPATGGSKGAAVNGAANANGNNGSDATDGGTGGGASGCIQNGSGGGTNLTSGAGADGTSFSGGSAGGSLSSQAPNTTASSATANGGAAGDAASPENSDVGGSAGQPGGAAKGAATAGLAGCGGVLIIITELAISGSGSITALGSAASGGGNGVTGGAASGGGSITIMYGTANTGPTPSAAGGAAPTSIIKGGRGGNGTARALQLPFIGISWRGSYPDMLMDINVDMVDSGFNPRPPQDPFDPTPN